MDALLIQSLPAILVVLQETIRNHLFWQKFHLFAWYCQVVLVNEGAKNKTPNCHTAGFSTDQRPELQRSFLHRSRYIYRGPRNARLALMNKEVLLPGVLRWDAVGGQTEHLKHPTKEHPELKALVVSATCKKFF